MTFYVFFVGLCFGSFAGMLVYRLNSGTPVFKRSRSFCPTCDNELKWYNNIPLFSFLFQKGKCSFCEEKISWHYPLIELATGLTMALIYFWYTSGAGSYYIAPNGAVDIVRMMLLAYLLLICSATDLMTGYIFDKVTFFGIVVGLALSLLPSTQMITPVESLLGIVIGYGSLLIIAKAFYLWKGVEGLGQGDMKMLAMIGAFIGFAPLPYIVLAASILSIIISGFFLLKNKGSDILTEFKFGQYLGIFAFILILFDYRYILTVIYS